MSLLSSFSSLCCCSSNLCKIFLILLSVFFGLLYFFHHMFNLQELLLVLWLFFCGGSILISRIDGMDSGEVDSFNAIPRNRFTCLVGHKRCWKPWACCRAGSITAVPATVWRAHPKEGRRWGIVRLRLSSPACQPGQLCPGSSSSSQERLSRWGESLGEWDK